MVLLLLLRTERQHVERVVVGWTFHSLLPSLSGVLGEVLVHALVVLRFFLVLQQERVQIQSLLLPHTLIGLLGRKIRKPRAHPSVVVLLLRLLNSQMLLHHSFRSRLTAQRGREGPQFHLVDEVLWRHALFQVQGVDLVERLVNPL